MMSVLAIYFKYSSNCDIQENFWTNGPALTTQVSCCPNNNNLGSGLAVNGSVLSSNPNLSASGMSQQGPVYGRMPPSSLGVVNYNQSNMPVSAMPAGPSAAANMQNSHNLGPGGQHQLGPGGQGPAAPSINCDRMITVSTYQRGQRNQTDLIRGDIPIQNGNPSNSTCLFGYRGNANDTLRVGATSVLTGNNNDTTRETASLVMGQTLDSAMGGISQPVMSGTPLSLLEQSAMNMAAFDQNKNVNVDYNMGTSGVSIGMF